VLLRAVPIRHNRLQAGAILAADCDCDTLEHTAESHFGGEMGILNRTQVLDFIH
jgi:hypothetical protein